MKKLLLVLAATSDSSFVLPLVQSAQAASLGLTVTENVSDNTTPVPGIPNLYEFKNLVSAQGQITSIDGFSSLKGVNPSSLTLNFGNIDLITGKNDGSSTPYFNFLENGQVIATSNNIQITGTTNTDVGSPDYGQATEDVKVVLNGVIGNPFFQEVQQLTNGTGILDLNLGTLTGIIFTPIISTSTTGVFTYTGGTLLAQAPTPTGVPEPSAAGGLLVLGAGWLLRKRVKPWKYSKLT